jgi:hypothetical protein
MGHSQNVRGLTLVELLIALGLGTVVLLGISQLAQVTMRNYQDPEKGLKIKTERAIERQTFSQSIQTILQQTSFAIQYQHTPIGADIAVKSGALSGLIPATLPAIRKYNPTARGFEPITFDEATKLWAATSVSAEIETLEFFRDQPGQIKELPVQNESPKVLLQSTVEKKIHPDIHALDYYTTWPLVVTGYSLPFFMLREAKGSTPWTHDQTIQGCTGEVFRRKKHGIDSMRDTLKNRLVLLREVDHQNWYVFQVVKDVTSCAGANPTYEYASLLLSSIDDQSPWLSAFNPPELNEFAALTNLFKWPNHPSLEVFPFLMIRPSIYESPQAPPAGKSSFELLKEGAKFVDGSVDFEAIPIELSALFLRPSAVQAGKLPLADLVMVNYSAEHDSVSEFNSLPGLNLLSGLTGRVIFARKLGTSSLQVFVYEKNN